MYKNPKNDVFTVVIIGPETKKTTEQHDPGGRKTTEKTKTNRVNINPTTTTTARPLPARENEPRAFRFLAHNGLLCEALAI